MLTKTWPLPAFLILVPDRVHSMAIATIINQLCRGQSIFARLGELENRLIWLTISDTNTYLRFKIKHGQFKYHPSATKPDVHIKASHHNFIKLLKQQEDPDTLFFSREICIEGNTEDCLQLKNLIDAYEFSVENHLNSVFGKSVTSRLMDAVNTLH